jgi:hypothetical protein
MAGAAFDSPYLEGSSRVAEDNCRISSSCFGPRASASIVALFFMVFRVNIDTSHAKLIVTAERAAKGLYRPEQARAAAARTDRLREKNRRHFGEQKIGVSIIREFRGPLSR